MPILHSRAIFCLFHILFTQGLAADASGQLVSSVSGIRPVKVAVYYESMCPDSSSFIVQQLLTAMLRAPELIYPVLIPYGKATTTQTGAAYEFTCQHGERECYGNKLHACAIAITDSREQQVMFAACMMNNYSDVERIAELCANQLGVPWNTVLQCANGTAGDVLLSAYGAITGELDPALTFVPTVLLNGERFNQTAILNDFWEEVMNVSAAVTAELRSGRVDGGTSASPVVATIYYEAKCPDSRNFVVNQLFPAVLRGSHLFDPVLIPFGKANVTETSDGYQFTCQHGETECVGNKLHACGISQAVSKTLQVTFVECMMSDYTDVEARAQQCSDELGLPWETIQKCANGAEGSELMNAYGSITKGLNPALSFVPTVTLNGETLNQTAILNDFWNEVTNVSEVHSNTSGQKALSWCPLLLCLLLGVVVWVTA